MSETATSLVYLPTSDPEQTIAVLRLARPQAANAFNEEMMLEISAHLKAVREQTGCRALILHGQGKHFSAGADLNWMKSAAEQSPADNRAGSETLSRMFAALAELPLPTIAVATGAAYGGAVGLIACCDYTIALEKARFCLSEVRLGLIPAVILPHLKRRMRPAALRRLSLSASVFDAAEDSCLISSGGCSSMPEM